MNTMNTRNARNANNAINSVVDDMLLFDWVNGIVDKK